MGHTGQSLPVLFILRLPADVWSFPFSGYSGTWVEPTRNPQLKSLPACPKHGHKYNCCLPEPPIFYFSHVDVNIRSCHTAVTNLMAALQEGEPMLLTFGAAAAWSSWSTPVPSCLQGTRTAGGEIHQLGPTQSNQSAQCYQQEPACCPQLQQEKKK